MQEDMNKKQIARAELKKIKKLSKLVHEATLSSLDDQMENVKKSLEQLEKAKKEKDVQFDFLDEVDDDCNEGFYDEASIRKLLNERQRERMNRESTPEYIESKKNADKRRQELHEYDMFLESCRVSTESESGK